jgi:hypothetical protein
MEKNREHADRHRAFNQKVLNRIARDPKFRTALLADAQKALRAAGLERELQELEAAGVEPGKVFKQCAPLSCVNTCMATCKNNTCLFTSSC